MVEHALSWLRLGVAGSLAAPATSPAAPTPPPPPRPPSPSPGWGCSYDDESGRVRARRRESEAFVGTAQHRSPPRRPPPLSAWTADRGALSLSAPFWAVASEARAVAGVGKPGGGRAPAAAGDAAPRLSPFLLTHPPWPPNPAPNPLRRPAAAPGWR